MTVDSLHKFTRESAKRFVSSKSHVIDATCGNGNDTLFLAELVHRGQVYAFDIQEQAIINTKKRCQNHHNISYICDSHANLEDYVKANVSLVIFNLGFLPNSDSTLTTESSSTISALKSSLKVLKSGGALLVTIYTGHDNHAEEEQILPYIKNLDKYQYNVLKYEFINLTDPPYLIIIEKK